MLTESSQMLMLNVDAIRCKCCHKCWMLTRPVVLQMLEMLSGGPGDGAQVARNEAF